MDQITKRIHVWIHGEYLSYGKKVSINPSYLKSWNTILWVLTEILEPSFGAIRFLVSLKTQKIVRSYEELENGGRYAALGNARLFSKRDCFRYMTMSEHMMALTKKKPDHYIEDEANFENPLLLETKKKSLTLIYVFVNARLTEPTKMVLTPTDLKEWNVTLNYMGYMLDVPMGIQYLCTVNGYIICDPMAELQHGFVYVALPFGAKFKKRDYLAMSKADFSVEEVDKHPQRNYKCCPLLYKRNFMATGKRMKQYPKSSQSEVWAKIYVHGKIVTIGSKQYMEMTDEERLHLGLKQIEQGTTGLSMTTGLRMSLKQEDDETKDVVPEMRAQKERTSFTENRRRSSTKQQRISFDRSAVIRSQSVPAERHNSCGGCSGPPLNLASENTQSLPDTSNGSRQELEVFVTNMILGLLFTEDHLDQVKKS